MFLSLSMSCYIFFFFFFNDTATTEIYTLSLHDALPIFTPDAFSLFGDHPHGHAVVLQHQAENFNRGFKLLRHEDRKSTRLNSSHSQISYAVFCLKKKKNNKRTTNQRS